MALKLSDALIRRTEAGAAGHPGTDAIERAAAIMARAGWDPHGMIELLDTIREQQQRDPGLVETFFSNHPSPQDRVEKLARVVPERRAGTRDSAGFQSIRSRLRR